MPDGFEVPLRVFRRQLRFSLWLKVSEDSRGTVLFFHGSAMLGERHG